MPYLYYILRVNKVFLTKYIKDTTKETLMMKALCNAIAILINLKLISNNTISLRICDNVEVTMSLVITRYLKKIKINKMDKTDKIQLPHLVYVMKVASNITFTFLYNTFPR